MENPIFELDEEYRKKWNYLGRDNILMGLIPIAAAIILFILYYTPSDAFFYIAFLFGTILASMGFMLLMYYFALTLNKPGLYEDGISPPANPMPWKYREGLFIPFKDIRRMEVVDPWNLKGRPRVPPIFVIETEYSNPKKPFKVHFYELALFFDKKLEIYDVKRMKLYYELLMRVKEIIDEHPGIERIPRERFQDILSKYPKEFLKKAGVKMRDGA